MTERDEGVVNSPLLLQDLVEKLVVLRKAVEEGGKRVQPLSHPLIAEKLRYHTTRTSTRMTV